MARFVIAALIAFGFAGVANAAKVEVEGKQVEVPICGGLAGILCSDREWCDYPDDPVCGIADYPGRCVPRPEICPKVYIPVCGCDGRTYGNECEANAGGTDIAHVGACRKPSE